MHHGKTGVGSQVALMVTCAESIMEDLNSVVCEDRGPEHLVYDIQWIGVHLHSTHR